MAGLTELVFTSGTLNPSQYYWGINPIVWLIILLGVCGIIGAMLGKDFKREPGEKQLTIGQSLKSAAATGVMGAVIGLIIAILLSIFPIVRFGFPALYGSLMFFIIFTIVGFAGFFVVGFLYFIVPIPEQLKMTIVWGIAGMALGVLLWVIFIAQTGPVGSYMSFAYAPVREKINSFFDSLSKFEACFYASPKCPFFIQWDEPTRENPLELFNADLQFSETQVVSNNINVLASLTVKNPELAQIELIPTCYLGSSPHVKDEQIDIKNLGKYSIGNKFVFPLTADELHTSFRCSRELSDFTKNVYIGYVIVELKRPVILKASWPIYIGTEPNMGRTKTIMSFNAPYSVALTADSDMPFEEGKTYDFAVVIKRIDENTNMTFLKELRIEFPDSILAECENFEVDGQDLVLSNIDMSVLKNITQYTANDERYSIACSMQIKDAPQRAVLTPIKIDASYDVVTQYETPILKAHG